MVGMTGLAGGEGLDTWEHQTIINNMQLNKGKCRGNGERMEQEACQQAKLTVKLAQVLGVFNPILLAELDVHVTQDGFSWGLWHSQNTVRTTAEFWPQVCMEQKRTV